MTQVSPAGGALSLSMRRDGGTIPLKYIAGHDLLLSLISCLCVEIGFGPLVRTTDADVFKQEINKLSAAGGGDVPEMCLSGLLVCVCL